MTEYRATKAFHRFARFIPQGTVLDLSARQVQWYLGDGRIGPVLPAWARTPLYTDEVELPAWARTLLYTDEVEPVWTRTTLYTDEAELPAWTRTTLYTDEVEPPAWARTLLYTDELEPGVWTRTTLYTDEAELPAWTRTTLYTDEVEPPAWARTLLYTDEAELPAWTRTTLYTDELEPEGPAGVSSGLRLYLDAADIGLADNALIDTWTDRAAAIPFVASGADRPTYKTGTLNGHPVVRLAGTHHLAVGSNPFADLVNARGFTVFVVMANAPSNPYGPMIAADGTPRSFYVVMDDFNNDSAQFTPDNPSFGSIAQTSLVGGAHLITGLYDGFTPHQEIRIDGVQDAASVVVPPTAYTLDGSNLWVGKDGFNRFYSGDIAEVVVYDRNLTPAEITAVETELMTKYNIV